MDRNFQKDYSKFLEIFSRKFPNSQLWSLTWKYNMWKGKFFWMFCTTALWTKVIDCTMESDCIITSGVDTRSRHGSHKDWSNSVSHQSALLMYDLWLMMLLVLCMMLSSLYLRSCVVSSSVSNAAISVTVNGYLYSLTMDTWSGASRVVHIWHVVIQTFLETVDGRSCHNMSSFFQCCDIQ